MLTDMLIVALKDRLVLLEEAANVGGEEAVELVEEAAELVKEAVELVEEAVELVEEVAELVDAEFVEEAKMSPLN